MKKYTLIALLITLNLEFKAQENISNKGIVINYEVNYPKGKPIIKSACFKNCITIMQTSKSMTKSFTEYGDIMSSITEDCFQTIYSSFPDQKILIKSYPGDMNKIESMYKIERKLIKTNETKIILGKTCNKIIAESTIQGTTTTNVFYMLPIPPNFNYCVYNVMAPEAIGIMLGCELNLSNGVIQEWVAKSISEEKIDPMLVKIPDDYLTMTMDEFQYKIANDKAFLKSFNSAAQLTDEYKKKMRKELWNSLATTLLNLGLEFAKELEANNLLPKSNIASESSAITNGTSSGKDGNSPEGIACTKNAKAQWEASKEYHDFYDNRNSISAPLLRYGELSKAKFADIILKNCDQYLRADEKASLTAARDNSLKVANDLNGNTINPK